MNYHLIDSMTLMNVIQLLDKYHWLMTSKEAPATSEERATIALILRSLRSITKREIDANNRPVC